MSGMGENMMARRHDKRVKRQEAFQQIAFGAAFGLCFFLMGLLWVLGVV